MCSVISHRKHRKHRKGPSQMAIYRDRLKARNCTKFDSKLFNGPAEIAEIAERGPSQMAIYRGRLKARNWKKILFKIYQNILCHHRWRDLHVTQKSRKSQKEAITDGDIYEGRLEARNCSKFNSKLFNGPAEIAEMTEIWGPSQMARYRSHR